MGYNLDLGQTALDTDAAPTIQSSNLRTRAIGQVSKNQMSDGTQFVIFQGNAFIVSDGASNVTLLAGTPEQKLSLIHI